MKCWGCSAEQKLNSGPRGLPFQGHQQQTHSSTWCCRWWKVPWSREGGRGFKRWQLQQGQGETWRQQGSKQHRPLGPEGPGQRAGLTQRPWWAQEEADAAGAERTGDGRRRGHRDRRGSCRALSSWRQQCFLQGGGVAERHELSGGLHARLLPVGCRTDCRRRWEQGRRLGGFCTKAVTGDSGASSGGREKGWTLDFESHVQNWVFLDLSKV